MSQVNKKSSDQSVSVPGSPNNVFQKTEDKTSINRSHGEAKKEPGTDHATKRRGRGRPRKETSVEQGITSNFTDTRQTTGFSNIVDSDLCPVCTTTTYKGGQVVQCANCSIWLHNTCIPTSLLPITTSLNWYCDHCYGSHFPNFIPAADFSSANWGGIDGVDISPILDQAYNTVVRWKPNFFKLPSGTVGKDFIIELTKLVNQYINNTSLQFLSMRSLMVIGPLLLQKPSKKSKNREHINHLKRRLDLWRSGKLLELISEGEAIQKRLTQGKHNPENHQRVFVRLMLQGKISAALKWISNVRSGVLDITLEVINKLKGKHPDSSAPSQETLSKLLSNPPPRFEPIIFEGINETSIEKAARSTKGSAGPSGMDSDMWRRLLCSKAYGSATEDLRYSISLLTRKLCTEFVDPYSIKELVSCRLIPLDKNPGIRPIGIGEVLRRIIGRAVTTHLKPEVIDAAGPLQLSAGQEGGAEAAVHAMRKFFEQDDCEAILLVDASNAYNSLHRIESLLQIQYICPEFSTYLINTYRIPSKLFISGGNGEFISSQEGTTQGDNTASGFYSLGVTPLVHLLSQTGCFQIWYADDAGGGGTLTKLKLWWEKLVEHGPKLGYHPEPTKSWLIVKPHFKDKAVEMFKNIDIKITTDGRKYLGSPLGTKEFQEAFADEKVAEWKQELQDLTNIALRDPQVCYAAYVFGLSKRWLYLMRTTPGISHLFEPLEKTIMEHFLTALFKQYDTELRDIIALPAKLGGLSIFNPVTIAENEYRYSTTATAPLVTLIMEQKLTFDLSSSDNIFTRLKAAKSSIACEKKIDANMQQALLMKKPEHKTIIEQQSVKGTSLWLTTLPIANLGFVMTKTEFQDALCLRYNMDVHGMPNFCACGKPNNVNHALSCMKGGYTAMRHNDVRDTEAQILREVCKDVTIEPPLIPSETLGDRARLDIGARGLWSGLEKTLFDVRIFHPGAESYKHREIESVFKQHETEKKKKYLDHVLNNEKCSFTPLVFSTHGAYAPEADRFHKRLATLLAKKRNILYSEAISYVRRRIRFSILRTTLISLRGFRGTSIKTGSLEEEDLNLIPRSVLYENLV